MKLLHLKTGNFFGKALLWFASILFLVMIIIQLSLWSGIKWLNSKEGNEWAQNNINVVLQDSNYKIALGGFHYRPFTAVKVSQLKISDADGEVAEIDNAKLSINISSLALKNLSFSLNIQYAKILRLPEIAEQENTSEPFQIPNIYFNKIIISKIDIQDLEISESILGQKINLSPQISGALSLSNNLVQAKLKLLPDVQKLTSLQNIPDKITVDGLYNAEELLFSLNKFDFISPLYSASFKGQTNLKNEGSFGFSGKIESNDLSSINPKLKGKVESTISVTGTKNNITLKSDGIINLEQFTKNDFTPVNFHIHSDVVTSDMKQPVTGKISINSTYQNFPILLNTQISHDDGLITLKDIKGSAPDIALTGKLNIKNALIEGDLQAHISTLNAYKKMIGEDINGSGDIKILFSHLNDIQAAVFNFKINDLKTKDISLLKSDIILSKSDTGYSLKAKGSGTYQNPFSFDLTTNLINLNNPDQSPKAGDIKAVLKIGNTPLNLTGSIDTKNIDINIDTKNLSLSAFPVQLPQTLNNITLSGTASAQGLMSDPILHSSVVLSPISLSKKVPDINIKIDSKYESGQATIDLNGRGTGIKHLQGLIKTPLKLSLNPFVLDISNNQLLDGKINISLQASEIAESLLPPQYDLAGFLTAQINLGGSVKNPSFSGNTTLKDGIFIDDLSGINLKNIRMSSLFDNNKITLQSLTANDNKDGKLDASGTIFLKDRELGETDINLSLKNYHLLYDEIADGLLNADINFSGTPSKYDISGTIKSDYIDINIPEKYNQSIPELNIVEKGEANKSADLLKNIYLNIKYIADNRIFVRGWGLDAEFGGKIDIKGNLNTPKFEGQLKSSRGRYEEFGKRFKLTKANLNFLGTIPPTPNLDITAETKADDVMAQVNLTGSINNPKIGFSSSPSLPEDEVLSRILFGRDLSTISPFQALQLAQTLRRFSGKGGGGFDPLAKIREATGFDDLRVETDEDGQANVGVGKYLTDKVYLEFEKGSGEDSGAANLQVEVTPDITVESELGQDTQGGAGVFWEWDY